ncbi:DUF3953 domain-containing protein [Paenisporosarcina antarctica]|uniref:DUF3953 domain-containing protein n=1 Tax=Paenisporosarcina antarctica TaxID=417367 RepID=A0A4V1AMM0_9BACL|nr:DUF3953 domain-containing protein [Paenisporosarcina antarctica]
MIISRIIVLILILTLSSYSLITENYVLIPYMILSLGVLVMITGLVELQKNKKSILSYFSIIASFFIFFVFIRGLIVSY